MRPPIIESGDPLVVVAGGNRIFCRSAYHARGYDAASAEIWLRRDVSRRVAAAARLLPPNTSLVIWDGWRSLELQTALFREFRDKLEATGLTGRALEHETNRFVSPPISDPALPPPHLTGGAVDLTLGDEQGSPLDMGGDHDELSDRSRTGHYERKEAAAGQTMSRDRRRLLCAVMSHVGFSNYPEEWWHFDIGNQSHHRRVGGPARYGAITELPATGHRSLASRFEIENG